MIFMSSKLKFLNTHSSFSSLDTNDNQKNYSNNNIHTNILIVFLKKFIKFYIIPLIVVIIVRDIRIQNLIKNGRTNRKKLMNSALGICFHTRKKM